MLNKRFYKMIDILNGPMIYNSNIQRLDTEKSKMMIERKRNKKASENNNYVHYLECGMDFMVYTNFMLHSLNTYTLLKIYQREKETDML